MDKGKRHEEHILSLLPGNQFHSCVLTTFSFDFNFFYHDVRSHLNRADIINTNVLVDDTMLQHYLGSVTGYLQKPIMVLNQDAEKTRPEHLLGSEGDFFGKQDFRRFIAEIIGQHFIILTNAQESDVNQYEQDILQNIKESAYWNAVCAIALAAIEPEDKQKPKTWILEMFMNLRENCGVLDCGEKAKALENFSALVNIVNTEDKDSCLAKMAAFWEEHERLYQKLQLNSVSRKGIHEAGALVYSKLFGFCHISASTKSGSNHKITLARPGFPPNAEKEEFPRTRPHIAEMVELTVMQLA